ncbi:shikimate dehydrogenase [Streptomyces sp. NPDC058374]|uniref:shikimate dehydrogenase n=1 Tax=Streptomyces sp. NPDC058374 TaxID=3346466 RepID=UPI00364C6B03
MPSTDTRRAAVLGKPVDHSLSPVLHRAAYAELGLDGWSYDRYETDEAQLRGFVAGLGPEWAGLSLTMPLKRAALALCETATPVARSVEAVNTLVRDADGGWHGDNTDVPGLVAALRERGVEKAPEAAVLGAGATASSALAALASIGAEQVAVYVRSEARAEEVREWGRRLGVEAAARPWERAAEALHLPLVIATTPAGAADALAAEVPERPGTLFDVLYEPWPTPLAARWAERGGTVLGGLDLLVHQAVLQVERMTGTAPAPLAAMRTAGTAALAAR